MLFPAASDTLSMDRRYTPMKITVEHAEAAENEVILRCPDLDEEMLGVLSPLRSGLRRLCVWDDSRQTTLLSPARWSTARPWTTGYLSTPARPSTRPPWVWESWRAATAP